jgi:hypothetical protein
MFMVSVILCVVLVLFLSLCLLVLTATTTTQGQRGATRTTTVTGRRQSLGLQIHIVFQLNLVFSLRVQSATPKKNANGKRQNDGKQPSIANSIMGSISRNVLSDFDKVDIPKPDLRLEAKLSAEVSIDRFYTLLNIQLPFGLGFFYEFYDLNCVD